MSALMEDEGQIRRLLLGQASESERDALEARILEDADLFDLAAALEDEMAGAYAAGTLSPAERRAFEAQLAVVPRLAERVRTAQALDRAAARLLPPPEPAWRRALAVFRAPAGAWQWSLASSLIVALAGGTWFQQELRTVRDETTALRVERDAARAEAQRLARAAEASAVERAQTFALAPGLTRASEGPARLQLAGAPGLVSFHLDLEAAMPGPFRAVLETSSGQQVFARHGLVAQSLSGYRFVELQVPTALLAAGGYRVRLESRKDGGESDAGQYAFELVPGASGH